MEELSLKEIQSGSLKILLKIRDICEENNWRYFLIYGTLLGAVRHKGFIPWDDDLDIAMPRPDYEKFIDYCIKNKDALSPLELKHYKTCKEYVFPIARLSDSRYDSDYFNIKDYGLGLFVDIYPIDGVEDNKRFYLKIKNSGRNIWYAGCKKSPKSSIPLKNILRKFYFRFISLFDINKMLRKFDELSQKYDYEKTERCIVTWDMDKSVDKNIFDEYVLLPFEGYEFRAPSRYDEFLKTIYGDYMVLPSEEDRIGHHNYRIWKKQNSEDAQNARG